MPSYVASHLPIRRRRRKTLKPSAGLLGVSYANGTAIGYSCDAASRSLSSEAAAGIDANAIAQVAQLYEGTKAGPRAGTAHCSCRWWNCSTASSLWCRHRVSAAAAISVCLHERRLTGIFRSDRERQELAVM